MIDRAIQKINPNAEFVVRGQDLETCEIEWLNGTTPITKETIQTKLSEAEFDEKLEDLRFKRNKLLIETDYLALSDNTMSEAMINYRQELRDITEGLTTVEDVEAVTFPTKP
tara:strand:+ start:523 stop:858 length:336 start_codon:yes stop_codon:yes gene_type:complete